MSGGGLQTHHDHEVMDQHVQRWLVHGPVHEPIHEPIHMDQDHVQHMVQPMERHNVPSSLSMMVHMVHKHDQPYYMEFE